MKYKNAKLNLIATLQIWRVWSTSHYHYFQIHPNPEWYYLLSSHGSNRSV